MDIIYLKCIKIIHFKAKWKECWKGNEEYDKGNIV